METAAVRDRNERLRANVERLGRRAEALADGLGVTLVDSAAAPPAVATVVVVGEPKNGKSSLVNVLVEHPGLSPVDYAVATATYIAIRSGPPAARVYPDGSDAPVEVPVSEVASWTSVEGLAQNPRASRVPRPVEVTLPAPLLRHVTLIDTPGVGGFDGSHDRATLAALSGATSLVFCADGSRPLSEPELAFLREATSSIARVAFVLTKVDQNPAWRDVLDDDRRKVAQHAPAFADAPWFPVAAPLAERSLDPGLSERAATVLRERSGLDAVRAHLVDDVAGRLDELVAANRVKQIRSDADLLRQRAVERVAVLDDPSEEVQQRLDRERDDLKRLASVEDQWRTDLDLSLTTLRGAEVNRLDRVMRETQSFGEQLAKDKSVEPDRMAEEVNRRLSEEAGRSSARIVEGTDQQVRAIVGEHVESPAFMAALEKASASEELVQLRESRDLVAEGRLQPAQTMPLVMSVSSGFMLANFTGLAGWAGGATLASIPLTFVPGVGLGLAAAATAVMFARRQSRQNERLQWLQTRLVEARTDMQTVIDQRVTTSKTLALRAVREWIRSRRAELESSISALDALARRDAAERSAAVAEARERVASVDELISTCDSYLSKLTVDGTGV